MELRWYVNRSLILLLIILVPFLNNVSGPNGRDTRQCGLAIPPKPRVVVALPVHGAGDNTLSGGFPAIKYTQFQLFLLQKYKRKFPQKNLLKRYKIIATFLFGILYISEEI